MPDKEDMLEQIFGGIMSYVPEKDDIKDWPPEAKEFVNLITGVFLGLAGSIALNESYLSRICNCSPRLFEADAGWWGCEHAA